MSTNKYFEKGFVTKRELQEALSGASGGLSSWNPITEPSKIQAGVYVAPGSFVLTEDYNGEPIDDVSSTSKGTIIYFYQSTSRWGIISAEDKYKGVYQDLTALQTAYPSANNGDYALVTSTGTFFAWFNTAWTNTGSGVAPDALRSTNNLSDVVSISQARVNLDVYSKAETNTQISNGVFSNVNIASNAGIETSKIKQTTIEPIATTPANNDTQDVLNNKFSGNIADLKFKVDNLPVGASSGDTLFLTNINSSILGYKELSKSPSASSQVAITTTANNNEVLAASFVNPIQIGKTKLDAGIWQTNLFAYADHSASCKITARFYKRNVGGTETLLFQVISPNIISVDPANPDVLSLETAQQEFVVNTTDIVVIKFFVSTTRTSNTNITFYHSGNQYFSHIHTPLAPNHNDLKGIQGGTAGEYNHLTNSQVALVDDVPNKIAKVPSATPNNFAIFNATGSVVDSSKNSASFEPADNTILKQSNIINNLTSTSTTQPLSANMGKQLQDTKANTSIVGGIAISAVGGALVDSNSIDFNTTGGNITAGVKTANSSKISLTTGATGIIADINAGSLINTDINSNANISTSKSQFTDALDPSATANIQQDDLLSTIIKKVANLLPVNNTATGKYLSANKTWSDLNQNAVGISSKVRKDGSDNIVFSSQATTDSGTQSDIDIRLGNTTTSATKGGNLTLSASNGTSGSGDLIFKTAPAPYLNIEVGTNTNFANSNIQNATFSHIVPADKTNRLLVVSFATAVSSPASAVSYGGQAMTQISSGPVASTSVNVQTFYLVNPPSGTANVVITRTNSGSIVANAVNIANVNQTNPITGAVETFNNNQTTSASLTLNSTTAGQVAIGVIGVINVSPTIGAGQVSIFNASSGNQERGASSYELVTGSSAVVSYTFANSSFALQSFLINQIGTDQLGQMQEIAKINSQGIVSNNIQRVSTYTSAQNLSLTEDLPTKLVFTSSVAGNSTIKLPLATRLVVGTLYEIINYNNNTITINYNDGTPLAQVVGNNQKYQILLTDNSTSNGIWLTGLDLTKGNLATAFSNRKQVFLSPNGSDNNNGFSQEGAVLTLSQALAIAGNSGNQVEVLPGTYTGDYSITQQNVSIVGSNSEGRGLCNFSGTLTSNNSGASSQLLQGLSINNVVNTSAGGLYIKNSTINNSLSNSANGYLEITHSDLGVAPVNITGSGNKNFISCNGGVYTINNAGAIVNIKDNLTVVSPTLTAGVLSISNATIYSSSNTPTVNAIDVASGGILYLSNVNIIKPDGTPARIRTQAGSFYSFSNVNFDSANSTLSGTSLAREFTFDNVKTNAINSIAYNTLTASGNKYKVPRLNSSENANNYEFAIPSLTTAQRDALVSVATNYIIYNSTDDKFQLYNGTSWVNIVSAGTGNVSVSGLTGATDKAVAFKNDNGTSVGLVSTLAQKQSFNKNISSVLTLTTADRNSLGWIDGDVIFNTTNGTLETYRNGEWYANYSDRQDFIDWIANGVNAGFTMYGNAAWNASLTAITGLQKGIVLTTATNNQKGIAYRNIANLSHKRLKCTINLVVGGGNGADGMWFSFFANAIPTSGNDNENTANNSYSLYLNEYTSTITLYYNGVSIYSTSFGSYEFGGLSHKKILEINLEYDRITQFMTIKASFIGAYGGTGTFLNYKDSNIRNLAGTYFLMGGKTGGLNNWHIVTYASIEKLN